jgi:hypothetical protein
MEFGFKKLCGGESASELPPSEHQSREIFDVAKPHEAVPMSSTQNGLKLSPRPPKQLWISSSSCRVRQSFRKAPNPHPSPQHRVADKMRARNCSRSRRRTRELPEMGVAT